MQPLLVLRHHYKNSFFTMSLFDPQGLYIHHQKKTKKGQVYQKKPLSTPSAITIQDLKRSLSVLSAYGYRYFAPGESPDRKLEWSAPIMFYKRILNLSPIDIHPYNALTEGISALDLQNLRDNILSHSVNELQSFEYSILITSYTMFAPQFSVQGKMVNRRYIYTIDGDDQVSHTTVSASVNYENQEPDPVTFNATFRSYNYSNNPLDPTELYSTGPSGNNNIVTNSSHLQYSPTYFCLGDYTTTDFNVFQALKANQAPAYNPTIAGVNWDITGIVTSPAGSGLMSISGMAYMSITLK